MCVSYNVNSAVGDNVQVVRIKCLVLSGEVPLYLSHLRTNSNLYSTKEFPVCASGKVHGCKKQQKIV